MKKLGAKVMERKARERPSRSAVIRALETTARSQADGRDRDTQPTKTSTSPDDVERMMKLADELGRLAADLYSEGKL